MLPLTEGPEPDMPAAYIHIPFCHRKCAYCDFYSVVTSPKEMDAFVASLCREIDLRAAEANDPCATVFFGGGTPSLLSPDQIETILSCLQDRLGIRPDAEITLEANPGTADQERLRTYRALGVTRLSLGTQSFRDEELRLLGRIHDRSTALAALEAARGAGFDNLSLDLISALPGQSLADWEVSLDAALAFRPQHVSAYSLTVEDDTPLAGLVRAGTLTPCPADLSAAMYERTMERLAAAGYDHYEVSNYAQPGFPCRHNMAYWTHQDYLGFGPAAHSFRRIGDGTRGCRSWNVADLDAYRRQLRDDQLPIAGREERGPAEIWRERIFLELRTGHLDLPRLARDFGRDLETERPEALRHLAEAGLLVFRDGIFDLTPRGFLLCDEICLQLTK
jgi:oxygen-independent coproporphyrinogen III oxidase